MFRRKKNFYNAYRGRRSRRNGKLLIAAIPLFLLALAALAYFVIPEYIVFSADGFRFTFQPEEEARPDAEGEDIPDEDLHIVIDGSPATTTPEADPDAPEQAQNTKAPAYPDLHGVADELSNLLSRETYGKGLAGAALERGCNTLVFTVKAPNGIVRLPILSSYATAAAEGKDAHAVKDALALLEDSDVLLAARLSAFNDAVTPRAFADASLRTGGSTWLDQNSQSWFDPRSEMAVEYLCDLIRACKSAGFDAVLLDDLCFPTKGRTELIDYGEEDTPDARRTALELVYQTLRRTADNEGISLSVILESDIADNEESGQYAADLAKYFHTIFVEGTPDSTLEAALESAVSGTDCRIGIIHKGAFEAPADGRSVVAGYLK